MADNKIVICTKCKIVNLKNLFFEYLTSRQIIKPFRSNCEGYDDEFILLFLSLIIIIIDLIKYVYY